MKALSAAIVLLAGCGAAFGEPLASIEEPICSSRDAQLAGLLRTQSPNCEAVGEGPQHSALSVEVVAKEQPVEIGEYRINNAFLYNGKVIPEVWSLDPGDTILLHLQNDMKGRFGKLTNLHTHGMIVSPGNASGTDDGGPLGDSVFASIDSGEAIAAPHHAPAPSAIRTVAEPGHKVPTQHRDRTARYEIALPADHPSGVYWYHPHPHGVSEDQVGAGLGGLIVVGAPDDYVQLPQEHGPIEDRLMMLKDFQIIRDKGEPNWDIYYDPNSHYCVVPPEERAQKLVPGACLPEEDRAWLFTLNGQLYPTIAIDEGRPQLWRLANTGSNVSYRLEVVERSADGTERRLPFQIVSADGVPVHQAEDGETIMQDSLLMMPSSRVEIYIAYDDGTGRRVPPDGATAILRQAGFYDEATPQIGFPWPPIDLAEVIFTPAGKGESVAPPSVTVEAQPPFETTALPEAPGAGADCPSLRPDQARIVVFDVGRYPFAQQPGIDFPLPPYCAPTEKYGRFYNTVGSVIASPGDVDTLDALLAVYDEAAGLKYPALLNGKTVPTRGKCFNGDLDTCVAYPAVETWWVVNASPEGHNFHIHQTRFQVLDVIGEDVNFTPNPNRFHDNYPVLIGQAIKLRIYFNRPEQVGYFVYHCHVLQHEDEGMMAAIELRDASRGR